MARFFGYKIIKSTEAEEKSRRREQSFVDDPNMDGSLDLSSRATGFSSYGVSFDSNTTDEVQLLTKYWELGLQPEIQKAVDDIVNEAFAYNEIDYPVEVNLEECEGFSEKTKDIIRDEFQKILDMLNFKNECYEIFRRWYVFGRLYYHKVIDVEDPKKGIKELKYIDPRKIKKVREDTSKNDGKTYVDGLEVNKQYVEYYVYNPQGINSTQHQISGLKISPNSITYIHSGIVDKMNAVILSHLHQAIKPFNQLRMMEDAVVIYRLVRAPERRIFNIEVGNLPKTKAEQHVQDVMRRFTKKIKYDPDTGEVQDSRRFTSMIEDFWFPQRDGKGTKIDTLQGGQTLGQIDDVDYFKKKLYEALNVPISRLEPSQGFNLGRPSDITRDELKFTKFISRLRRRFSGLFEDILGDQLIMKGILTVKEWETQRRNIAFDFIEDNFFSEFKNNEIWMQRVNTFQQIAPLIGEYVSRNWVRKNILHISEEEWEELNAEIKKEPPPPDPDDIKATGGSGRGDSPVNVEVGSVTGFGEEFRQHRKKIKVLK